MALVRVRFFATFREASGCPETSAEAADVSGLLDQLSARYGEPFRGLLRDPGKDSFVILVNGRNMGQVRGLVTPLNDGDEVSLFPPVSGG